MAVSSSLPQIVDLSGYAGDTLTRRIEILTDPGGFVAGRTWSAQVRGAWNATEVDATFTCTPDPTGCTVVLSSADTSALLGLSATRAAPGQYAITGDTYSGVWDVQLAPAGGGDPTTSVCRGRVTITGDVTRG